jgi:hypothetical protein
MWCQENNLSLKVNKTKEKFLGIHITDKLKTSTHTDSVVKKAQQRLFNLKRLKKCGLSCHLKPSQTFTDAQLRASYQAVSPPCMATAPPTTARLSRRWCGLHNSSPGANYLPSRTPAAPDVTGRPKGSSRTTTT